MVKGSVGKRPSIPFDVVKGSVGKRPSFWLVTESGTTSPGMRTLLPSSGMAISNGLRCLSLDAAEGKIEADTAGWTQVIQGHSQERRHGERQRSGPAGYDMGCWVKNEIEKGTPTNGVPSVKFDSPIGPGA